MKKNLVEEAHRKKNNIIIVWWAGERPRIHSTSTTGYRWKYTAVKFYLHGALNVVESILF